MTAFHPTPLRPDWPAMPSLSHPDFGFADTGLTARQHAAIALRVPDSGCDWLDEMIRTSLRDEFAGKAMQSMVAAEFEAYPVGYKFSDGTLPRDRWAQQAHQMASAMLAAREAK